MSILKKRKGERVFDDSTDNSHPEPGGNLVLLDNGQAWYAGYRYYREGYTPKSAVKPEPAPTNPHLDAFPIGTRVRVVHYGGNYLSRLVGKEGTVVEPVNPDYLTVTLDDSNVDYMTQFSPGELEIVPAKPQHRHPEGLYQSGGTRVVIRHEAEDETYSILYIDNALDGKRDPVNRGMTQVSELGYTLVTEFKA